MGFIGIVLLAIGITAHMIGDTILGTMACVVGMASLAMGIFERWVDDQ